MSLALALLMGGCGGTTLPNPEITAAPRSDGTPTAVKVNGDAISVQQVNNVLQSAPKGLTPEQQSQATGQAAINLVDQQLLQQQAIQHKLDRDPEVQAAIEIARGKILAEAYLKRDLFADINVTDPELHTYYDENPALFAQHRVFSLQEIDIPSVTSEKAAQLAAVVNTAKGPQQVVQWLQDNKIEYGAKAGVRGAEQLPLALLPKVAQLKDGQIGLLQGEGRATVIQLVRSELKPVTFDQARPAIENFLKSRQQNQRTGSEVARLRQSATLDFLGDYAKFKPLAQAKLETTAQTARAAGAPQ